jgi:phosphate transport system substrate-binding protein
VRDEKGEETMTKCRTIALSAATLAALVVGAACSSSSSGGSFKGVGLTGAGATFPQPIYALWSHSFQSVQSGAKVNYQAIGSGGGVQQFTSKTVDFGATDVPLQDADIGALTDKSYIQFPTVLGGVAITYNVSGIESGLKLDGSTVADIFLGKVNTWNDPEITTQNPDLSLPGTAITTVHRTDESGTTAVFTGWLALESQAWKDDVGAGKAVQWPVGNGGNGNAGVTGAVKQSDGTIGYVSYDFAVTANLGIAQIMAKDGTYVAPSIASITAAGGGLQFPIASTTNILDSPAPGAYPIASTTYILIYTNQTNKDKAQTLVDFWTWALTKGQSQTNQVNYAPLPQSVVQGSLEQVQTITANGQPVTASSGI